MGIAKSVKDAFQEKFKEHPYLFCSPGRVNLLGEHTDYNMGYVLPGAIDKAIYFAMTPRKDRRCVVVALDMHEEHEFLIDDLQVTPKGWPQYLMGVVDQFIQAHYVIKGFNCVFGGDIPIGAGMSSSAAIEAGLAFALNYLFDLRIDDLELVKLAQKAENDFVGVQCGIMDQYINIYGERDTVLRIDCRSLDYKYYPFAYPDISIVLFDSRVSHSLASSQYNRRREECGEGVALIKKCCPDVRSLRDVSREMLAQFKSSMNSTIYKRCKYVIEENDRVVNACRELEKGNLKAFGVYMKETHQGLSREYEVSCEELDFLVELVKEHPAVYGSRMMGGGFGGCTINLIEKNHVEEVSRIVTEKYNYKFNKDLRTYVTTISSGTKIIIVKEHAAA